MPNGLWWRTPSSCAKWYVAIRFRAASVIGGTQLIDVATERDHLLGLSYSPRLYVAHINVWNKHGANVTAVEALKKVILDRLSAELRPADKDVYYKKHSEHDGWEEAVQSAKP